MLNFIYYSIICILALYGLLEIIKNIINIYSYTKLKSEGIYFIIAVKDQENKIEGFLRTILFRIIYGKEDSINNIIIADLNSEDNTRKILDKLSEEYGNIKIVNWNECKEIIENVNNV